MYTIICACGRPVEEWDSVHRITSLSFHDHTIASNSRLSQIGFQIGQLNNEIKDSQDWSLCLCLLDWDSFTIYELIDLDHDIHHPLDHFPDTARLVQGFSLWQLLENYVHHSSYTIWQSPNHLNLSGKSKKFSSKFSESCIDSSYCHQLLQSPFSRKSDLPCLQSHNVFMVSASYPK